MRFGFAAKGAGMIAPNMATMLCFVTCAAAVSARAWQTMMAAALEASFNRITVDGQESTNDMVLGIANGAAGIRLADSDLERLSETLEAGMLAMALAVVADGEGATTTVRLQIQGACDRAEAQRVARAIADSTLVKTAIYGHDANWGRIVQSAGMVLGADCLGPLLCDLALAGLKVADDCAPVRLDEADESYLRQAMDAPELELSVDLHRGRASSVVYFSELTHDYVRLNAGART
ncbi:MAG: bifunctional ornithine acetyltransferase/N-acetylglutamate synthase [Actinobacteria bacterium]|nr:bifunctional ornithine acetyltransferase/N-acetylglutamate synthase [Actinomycetota bacterium]